MCGEKCGACRGVDERRLPWSGMKVSRREGEERIATLDKGIRSAEKSPQG